MDFRRRPVVPDIATTMTSYGRVKLAAQKGESIPVGWMIDKKQGQPLTDPERSSEGFLVPIGGYKGYGLNVVTCCVALQTSLLDVFPYTPRSSVFVRLASNHF